MAGEKLVESLKDLHNAARVAAQRGMYKVRLSSGETFALGPIHPGIDAAADLDEHSGKAGASWSLPRW